MPTTLPGWRNLVRDILDGMMQLHTLNIVHRDVREANIVEMPEAGGFALIDFEHSGMANTVPPFQPLAHWPPECRQQGAPYTTAADIYSLGWVITKHKIVMDIEAEAFCDLLISSDPARRPSAADARAHAWLSAA